MSERSLYFRKDGTPYTNVLEFARDFENGNGIVKQTILPNGLFVSTVWLGIDHNFGGIGRPLIYETMVFPKDSLDHLDMDRYSTMDEAKAGHSAMVEKWKARD